jgi:putative oxidoreductase
MFTLFDAFCRFTLVPLLLRAGLAAIFIYHGLDMVQKDGGAGWNPRLSRPEQLAVAWGELLGGIALALGLLTRLAAFGIAVIMAGAIYKVHWAYGFSILAGREEGAPGGWEYNFLIIVVCVAVMLLGPGNAAVDRFFRFRRKPAA